MDLSTKCIQHRVTKSQLLKAGLAPQAAINKSCLIWTKRYVFFLEIGNWSGGGMEETQINAHAETKPTPTKSRLA